MKKPFYKRWWFILLVILIIGGIGAGTSGSSDNDKKSDVKPAKTEYKVGEKIKTDEFNVTVNKVYDIKPEYDFMTPNDGNKYVGIDITLENISDEEQAVSSIMMFKVVDKEDRSVELSLGATTAADAGQLDGSLQPGKKMRGVYGVEIKKNNKVKELQFTNSLIGKGTITVKLDK